MPSFLLWKPYGGFSLADLSPSGFKAVASDPAYIAADCFSIPPSTHGTHLIRHPASSCGTSFGVRAISVRVRERGVCRLCLALFLLIFVSFCCLLGTRVLKGADIGPFLRVLVAWLFYSSFDPRVWSDCGVGLVDFRRRFRRPISSRARPPCCITVSVLFICLPPVFCCTLRMFSRTTSSWTRPDSIPQWRSCGEWCRRLHGSKAALVRLACYWNTRPRRFNFGSWHQRSIARPPWGCGFRYWLPRSLQSVKVLGVCHVIPRGASFPDADQFARMAAVLNYYVSVVLETLPSVFCWTHRDFTSPLEDLYLPDGVHLNPTGQYLLYRSYRGAILHALRCFWSHRPLLLSPHWRHFIVYSLFMFLWRRRLLPHFSFPFGFCFTTALLLLGLSFIIWGCFPISACRGLMPGCLVVVGLLVLYGAGCCVYLRYDRACSSSLPFNFFL